jgi:hypothetical protein
VLILPIDIGASRDIMGGIGKTTKGCDMENTVSDFARNIAEIYPSNTVRAFSRALIAYEDAGGFNMPDDAAYDGWRRSLHGYYGALTNAERTGVDAIEREMGVLW